MGTLAPPAAVPEPHTPGSMRFEPTGAGSSGVSRVVWAVAAVVLFLLAFGVTVLVANSQSVLPGA